MEMQKLLVMAAFKDEQGATRHAMSNEDLQRLYKGLEDLLADLTREEAQALKPHWNEVATKIHELQLEK